MIFDREKEEDNLTNHQKTILGASIIKDIVKAGGCDLHMHTHASDGQDNAASLIQKAIESKLACFSVTDHDSIEGVKDVLKVLNKLKSIGINCPKFIPGIELSVQEKKEVHILGYFPFGGYERIEEFLIVQRERRHERNIQMCKLLTKNKMPISINELQAEGGKVVGRMHAANILIRKGLAGSMKGVFSEWIGEGKPCYVKRVKPTAKEAIESISGAGGVPVVAHPYLYGWTSGSKQVSDVLIKNLEKLKAQGLLGVEAFHREATLEQKTETQAAARTLDLFCTAGSDYHGSNKPGLLMYDGSIKFFRENECIIVAGILKTDNKVFVIKKQSGINAGKWHLPGSKKPEGKNGREFLKDTIQEIWGIKVDVKSHYLTVVHDYPQQRVTLITHFCDFDKALLTQKADTKEDIGIFSLGDLSQMDLLIPDGIVIDKLREISFF